MENKLPSNDEASCGRTLLETEIDPSLLWRVGSSHKQTGMCVRERGEGFMERSPHYAPAAVETQEREDTAPKRES